MTTGYLVTLSRCKLHFPHSKIMSNIIEPNKAILDTGLTQSTTMVFQSFIYRIETTFLQSQDSCQISHVVDFSATSSTKGLMIPSSPRALLVQEVYLQAPAKGAATFLMI